jgi:hypothetical protein
LCPRGEFLFFALDGVGTAERTQQNKWRFGLPLPTYAASTRLKPFHSAVAAPDINTGM